MKKGVFAYSLSLVLLAAPVMAWADADPDFDEDAKPILRSQPGLLHYVQSRFDVKDTGQAKYPGDDDRRPAPPYIFHARPRGSEGPYTLLLLIQPGPPGHVLGVVDSTKVHLNAPPQGPGPGGPAPSPYYPPEVAQAPQVGQPAQPTYQSPSLSQGELKPIQPETPAPPAQNPPTAEQPAASSSQEPTADTPSGPIVPNSNGSSSASPQPTLAPPPDPAPAQ